MATAVQRYKRLDGGIARNQAKSEFLADSLRERVNVRIS